MKRVIACALVGALAVALLCLGASETLTNRTGKTASGVVITFSESVRISSYDESTFPDQSPSGRADTFTFSGGALANGGRFKVSWSPSNATITDTQWLQGSTTTSSAAATSMGFSTTSDTPVVPVTFSTPSTSLTPPTSCRESVIVTRCSRCRFLVWLSWTSLQPRAASIQAL